MCWSRIKSFFSRPKAKKVEAKQPDQAAKAAGAGKAPGDAETKAGGTSK